MSNVANEGKSNKYPMQCWSTLHTKQTMSLECQLSPPREDEDDAYLGLHSGYSRFVLTIIDKEMNDAKVVKSNIRALGELPYLLEQYQTAKLQKLIYDRSSDKKEELSPAYRVTIKTGAYKGKTPAEILLSDPTKSNELLRSRDWLKSNLDKYPANKEVIDAIEDAVNLLSVDQLLPVSSTSDYTLFDEKFKAMSGGPGKKIKASIKITCNFDRKNCWCFTIENNVYYDSDYNKFLQGNTDVKPIESKRCSMHLNDKEMASFIKSIKTTERLYETMIFPVMWEKSNEVSKNNYLKAKEKAEAE